MTYRRRWLALLLIPAVAAIAAIAPAPAQAQPPPLVYICQQPPCASAQEFEVFDGYGAPIMSVGEYGGLGVDGDNISVTGGPGRVTQVSGNVVFWPSVVTSYESPARYLREHPGAIQAARCMVPARWDAPGGTWKCVSGRWVLALRL